MASLFNKALLYLGLVDEEQAAAEPAESVGEPEPRPGSAERRLEPVSRVEGRRVEPPQVPVRSSYRAAGDPAQPSPVRPIRPSAAQSDILVVEEYGDAKLLADRVRDRIPVVLDLRTAEPDLVRRVIDFSSGLIYGLEGTMSKVAEGVVLVLPPRVVLSQEEKRRLSRLGFFDLAGDV